MEPATRADLKVLLAEFRSEFRQSIKESIAEVFGTWKPVAATDPLDLSALKACSMQGRGRDTTDSSTAPASTTTPTVYTATIDTNKDTTEVAALACSFPDQDTLFPSMGDSMAELLRGVVPEPIPKSAVLQGSSSSASIVQESPGDIHSASTRFMTTVPVTCSTDCSPQQSMYSPVLVASECDTNSIQVAAVVPLAMTAEFPAAAAPTDSAPKVQLQQLDNDSEFFILPTFSQCITTKVVVHRPMPWPSFVGVHADGDETRPLPWPSFREINDCEFPSKFVEKAFRQCSSDSFWAEGCVAIEYQMSEFCGNLVTSTGHIITHDLCNSCEWNCSDDVLLFVEYCGSASYCVQQAHTNHDLNLLSIDPTTEAFVHGAIHDVSYWPRNCVTIVQMQVPWDPGQQVVLSDFTKVSCSQTVHGVCLMKLMFESIYFDHSLLTTLKPRPEAQGKNSWNWQFAYCAISGTLLLIRSSVLKYMDLWWFATVFTANVNIFSDGFSMQMVVTCSVQPNTGLTHVYHHRNFGWEQLVQLVHRAWFPLQIGVTHLAAHSTCPADSKPDLGTNSTWNSAYKYCMMTDCHWCNFMKDQWLYFLLCDITEADSSSMVICEVLLLHHQEMIHWQIAWQPCAHVCLITIELSHTHNECCYFLCGYQGRPALLLFLEFDRQAVFQDGRHALSSAMCYLLHDNDIDFLHSLDSNGLKVMASRFMVVFGDGQETFKGGRHMPATDRSKELRLPWDPGGAAAAWGQAEFQGGRGVSDLPVHRHGPAFGPLSGLGPFVNNHGQHYKDARHCNGNSIRLDQAKRHGGLPLPPGSHPRSPSCFCLLAQLCLYPNNCYRILCCGGSAAPYMPSAAAPMGIYERRHHHTLADASSSGAGAIWADPFRYMASAPAAPNGMELLAEPKFEHHMVDVQALALQQEAHQLPPPSPDSSSHQEPARPGQKRRLAQNREAARKSRLRKKAYIQNLETSRVKLARMEQELNRARQQQQMLYAGASSSSSGSHVGLPIAASFDPGVAAFEVEYARWVEEQTRQTRELRAALELRQPEATENRLRALAEAGLAHYDRMFSAKSAAAHSDVFFVMSGVWRPAAERFFLWIAGFRSSDLLKVLAPQLEPLTEEQQAEVGRLRQTARQAEDALSQGMEKLQQSLAESLLLSSTEAGEEGGPDGYVGRRMASAMGRLRELAGFVEQADHLRQQTLRNMYRILTPRQAAVGLLALGDYSSRLQALSKLWAERPREIV